MAKYIKGDIHEVIKTIEDASIDCIYTNPPFGTTHAEWDKSLNWSVLWEDIWRVLKPNGVAVLHCAMPFTYDLIRESPVNPKYHYCWVKENSTCFFNAKKQPLRQHEEILVFYKRQPTYNPQMRGNEVRKAHSHKQESDYYNKDSRTYDPESYTHVGRYPTTFLNYKRQLRGGKTVPDEMIEFFIKTYTNENDSVLDMTCYSDVVGNVVVGLNRRYTGVDINL